jgi:hypothetical protein
LGRQSDKKHSFRALSDMARRFYRQFMPDLAVNRVRMPLLSRGSKNLDFFKTA